jgi:hypothetical protein
MAALPLTFVLCSDLAYTNLLLRRKSLEPQSGRDMQRKLRGESAPTEGRRQRCMTVHL